MFKLTILIITRYSHLFSFFILSILSIREITSPGGTRKRLKERLQQLQPEDFTKILSEVFQDVLKLLNHVVSIHELLVAVFSRISIHSNTSSTTTNNNNNNNNTNTNSNGNENIEADKDTNTNGEENSEEENNNSNHINIRSPVAAIKLSPRNANSSITATIPLVNLKLPEDFFIHISNESKEIVYAITELTHVKTARILKTRNEVNSRLSMSEFVPFYDSIQKFIQETESFCGKQCHGLRSTLLAQVCTYKFCL